MKYILFFYLLFALQGCVFTTSTNTINRVDYKTQKNQKIKKTVPIEEDRSSLYNIQIQKIKKSKNIYSPKTSYTGSIKGTIKKLAYKKSKKSWLYVIDGKDTSNGKLPYAKFYNSKKLANVGDFVYVVLNNSTLKELFFIKKANKITKRRKIVKKIRRYKKTYRRDKTRKSPGIGVPEVENVTF